MVHAEQGATVLSRSAGLHPSIVVDLEHS